MPGLFRRGGLGLSGHLGAQVSALVDGQLDEQDAERAWAHVLHCPPCRRLVEREGWVKRQLAQMAGSEPAGPPPRLLGSLYGLDAETEAAWAAVEELEHRARTRRRAGLAVVGVGSVSAAVLGLSTLSGASLGIGGAPTAPPASSLTGPTASPTGVASVSPGPQSPSTADASPFARWTHSRPVSVRSSR